jgi:L-ascorbate metabolism protein UlaG (beta-lactamase superfamily)
MSTTITWFGHSCFSLETDAGTVLVDPFLDDSPVAPTKASAVAADFILVTHGHFDHISDAVAIAKRTSATVVANFEIGEWLKREGVAEEKVVGMNTGGAVELPFGRVKFTYAQHSSVLPDGSYGGAPGGYVVQLPKLRIYFAGDTALMLDLKLIGLGGLDVAVLPIGDLYTMGPEDSIEAIKFLNPRRVIPCHYNTWPPIAQDAAKWADRVRLQTAAEPIVLELGEEFPL